MATISKDNSCSLLLSTKPMKNTFKKIENKLNFFPQPLSNVLQWQHINHGVIQMNNMSNTAKEIVDATLLVINNLDEIYGAEDEQDYVLAMDALIAELNVRRANALSQID